MKSFFTILTCVVCISISAQQLNDETLFTVDDEPVKSKEFLRVYNKNLDLVQDESQKDVVSYLDLFINYKLKVKEAKRLGFDQDKSYLREFGNYKKQLTNNYMTDNKATDKLVEEAYNRSIKDIKASHVLVRIDANETDTIQAWDKITKLRERVIDEGYKTVQKEVHDGKTIFAEDLGYFSAFKMVYPFETAAYNTKVGEVSKPFRTRFGYHFVKVWDSRQSLGEVTVAHIMVSNTQKDSTLDVEQRINQIYEKLQNGENFESLAKQFSDDKSSASKGGILSPFTGGQLSSKEFEDVAFSLNENGDLSKPFKTDYGWHIVKLIGKKGIQPFEEMQSELQTKVKRDSRSKLIKSAMTNKLKKQYNVRDNNEALKYFESIITEDYFKRGWTIPEGLELEKQFLTIKDTTYNYSDFAGHLFAVQRNYTNKKLPVNAVIKNEYESYLERLLVNYKKEHLEEENEEYAQVLNEYRDGLLLFDLMQQEVWNKASKDSVGLNKFYDENKSNYQWKQRGKGVLFSSSNKKEAAKIKKMLKKQDSVDKVIEVISSDKDSDIMHTFSSFESGNRMLPEGFKLKKGISNVFEHNDSYHVLYLSEILPEGQKTLKEARGQVVSDYQIAIENDWIESLRNRYTVKVNNDVLERLKTKIQN